MSNNIYDNNVSKKVVWEGYIPHDEATSSTSQPQVQEQPQMMFCYNCNNVIPGNSIYCPCCQVKLFTECPKCGAKYSSQYPSCSQCGTNREEYLQMQRKEQERIEARKREERLRQEKLEREKQERERQEKLRRYEQEAKDRKLRAEYEAENDRIVKTKEYQSIFSIVKEGHEAFRKKSEWIISLTILFLVLFPLLPLWIIYVFHIKKEHTKGGGDYIKHYASKQNIHYDEEMLNEVCRYHIDEDSSTQDLSKLCIYAYRKKNGLPIQNI